MKFGEMIALQEVQLHRKDFEEKSYSDGFMLVISLLYYNELNLERAVYSITVRVLSTFTITGPG